VLKAATRVLSCCSKVSGHSGSGFLFEFKTFPQAVKERIKRLDKSKRKVFSPSLSTRFLYR